MARERARRIDPNDRSVDLPAPFAPDLAHGSALEVALSENDELYGPYTVHEQLGEGGMATVHRADRDGWERNGVRAPIALKRLFRELSEDTQFVEAFLQEARLAKLLDHPNIARSYEHGKIDGQYFMAIEYVPGPTLREIMIQSRTAAGAIPLRVVVEILVQLTDALAHAHDLCDEHGRRLGLVHRDVTPANIIVSTSGVVKLIDFGIAKAAYSRVQTQAGFIKGKISYIAPEYTRGKLDHRADLFAVGVIAHELLTGRRLFDGESQGSVIGKLREQPIQPPSRHDPQIPLELDDVVMLALQRDPKARWQNASAMRNALAAVGRQLGARVTGKELCAWVEWAFTREPWRDSFVGKLVDRLDTSGARSMPLSSNAASRSSNDGSRSSNDASRSMPSPSDAMRSHDASRSMPSPSDAMRSHDAPLLTSSILVDDDGFDDDDVPDRAGFDDDPATRPMHRVAQAALISRTKRPREGSLPARLARSAAQPTAPGSVKAAARSAKPRIEAHVAAKPSGEGPVAKPRVEPVVAKPVVAKPVARPVVATPVVAKPARIDDSRTRVDNVLDGWAPPTGTEMVRPNAPRQTASGLWVLCLALVLAGAFAALAWSGLTPLSF